MPDVVLLPVLPQEAAMLRFTGDARSEAGLVRHGNEDSGFVSSTLLLVADGVGGKAGGEVASATTAWTVASQATERVGLRPASVLARAAAEAQRRLAYGVDRLPQLSGMATTLTALLTDGRRCALAHVGDSRAHVLRDGVLSQVSTDHTWVQAQLDAGAITEAEAGEHPWRNVVTRTVNGEEGQCPDLVPLRLVPGDRLVLCSDGLSDLVDATTVADVLSGSPDGEAADRLVAAALRAGGKDNVTVVVATVHDVAHDDIDPTGGFVGAVLDPANVLQEPVVGLGASA